jgi:hypothetical protein
MELEIEKLKEENYRLKRIVAMLEEDARRKNMWWPFLATCAKCGHNVALKQRNYTPDLVLGNGVIIEIKGKFTGEMRTKMLAVRRCNPDLDIRMLFQADNWLTKKKATRYSDWCERNGFIYHIGEVVPSEWIE